jgi:hypothetical protein
LWLFVSFFVVNRGLKNWIVQELVAGNGYDRLSAVWRLSQCPGFGMVNLAAIVPIGSANHNPYLADCMHRWVEIGSAGRVYLKGFTWENNSTRGRIGIHAGQLHRGFRTNQYPLLHKEKRYATSLNAWGSSVILDGISDAQNDVSSHRKQLESQWFGKLNTAVISDPWPMAYVQGITGNSVGYMRFPNVEEQTDDRQYFKESLPIFPTLLYFLLGLLLFGWGWFRWKGLYYYPDGPIGYILASVACIAGIIVWWYGIPWSKAF